MALCPKDMRACCDDLCYGSGCLRMPGVGMLHQCVACGHYHSDEDDCEAELDDGGLPDEDGTDADD